ncbi:MAG TPA: cell division protein FtsQ/DivIB [Rhizomicrobium sp.]|jgi:cell division protein FtsQ|nr:cell division protein FtsQ/DivIB [Rhizomicrobium sp.]
MRSVTASTTASRSRGRASPSRRSAPARKASSRSGYDRRMKTKNNPFSWLIRAIGNALNPRRPAVLTGLAMLLVIGFAALYIGGYFHRGSIAASGAASMVASDAGLEISAIQLSGNRYASPAAISAQLGFGPGESIFTADPQQARANLRKLDWIADAQVSLRYPDTVLVHIVEKAPFALWQSDHGLYAVDRNGHPITPVGGSRFKHLPLFFGDEPDGAADLVRAVHAHRAVAARVKAMQRVSGRRWNLVLDDGVLVKLPEESWQTELAALERLIVEDGVLERDIREIDLRVHDNYVFVLRHVAPRKNTRGEPT